MTGTNGTMVLYDTVYVLYRFISVPSKVKVFAGMVMVMKECTSGIPVKYPNAGKAQQQPKQENDYVVQI